MQNYSISQVLKGIAPLNNEICVKGWVRTRRDSKAGISFLQVYDGSCFDNLQAVVPQALENYSQEVLHLTAGCSVEITGTVVESPAQGQAFELQATQVKVLGMIDDPETYPISPKHHTLEYLREVAHLRPRTNTIGAVTRIRHSLAQAVHQYFSEQGCYWVHTPIITSNDCEGAGELFRVSTLDLMNVPKTDSGDVDFAQDFFGQETYLTVSGQLNVEAYCCALSKVYTFGPTFRSENSNTSRHLAEFWMIEPEIAFADLQDDIKLAEGLLKFVLQKVMNEREDDMAFFEKRVDKQCIERAKHIIDTPFEQITYSDAVTLLKKAKKSFEFPVAWGQDLQSEHERYLCEDVMQKPVVVTDYPKEIKGFYMHQNDDGKTVAAMDILAPGIGEIIGGSQREARFDKLTARMQEMNLNLEQYRWYTDLRRYGTVPHAGFGLGFERLICYVTGISNVRDVIPFPRLPGNAKY